MKPAKILGGAGAGLLLLAIIAFIAAAEPRRRPRRRRPRQQAAAARPTASPATMSAAGASDRSRVTICSTDDVPLDWTATGCVNGRTQYAQNGEVWSRILVPNEQQVVSVLRVPAGDRRICRHPLPARRRRR